MSDRELYLRVIDRYIASTKHDSNKPIDTFDVIVFLEKEINCYRETIENMKRHVENMCAKKQQLNAIYGVQTAGAITEQRAKINDEFYESVGEAVQEMANKWAQLSERVEQLGQMVENKMDQLLGETVQTLTTFTEERTSDGGVMTLMTKPANWRLAHECLLSNGYFVCCHVDDESNGETITIEFWKE